VSLKHFDEIIAMVKSRPATKRVVLAAAQDHHSLQAIYRAKRDGLATPVLVGDEVKIHEILAQLGESIEGENLYHVPDREEAATKAVELIRKGKADFLMKGKLETAQLLRAVVKQETGLRTHRVMSHLAILSVPTYHKLLACTDGGMLLTPDLNQKRQLIENAVEFLHRIGYQNPKVAVLAAAETVNPKMQDSLDGAELKAMNQRGEITGCIIEGPISMDLSLAKEKAETKGYQSPVAGNADLLVVPDITCGNVVTKAMVELAGATMAGLVLGAKVPIILTSRASSTEEKYLSICLAAASCQSERA
jgi:phosphate butyryltransferase